MAQTCVVFSCMKCGHKENVASEEYNKTLTATQPSLKTLSGKTIVYRPVPDSFICPNCEGDMILNNCTVTEPREGLIVVSPVHESVEKVNEEERQHREAKQHDEIISDFIAMLQPSIDANIRRLEKMEGVKVCDTVFHTEPKDRPRIALINTLARLCSHAYKWCPAHASDLCFRLLEEVNFHTEAEQVAKLLKCWHRR